MTRTLPARYQLIRQTDTTGSSKLGVLGHIVEFPGGLCVMCPTDRDAKVFIYEDMNKAKAAHATDGATIERID